MASSYCTSSFVALGVVLFCHEICVAKEVDRVFFIHKLIRERGFGAPNVDSGHVCVLVCVF